jgi:hypothetical protein
MPTKRRRNKRRAHEKRRQAIRRRSKERHSTEARNAKIEMNLAKTLLPQVILNEIVEYLTVGRAWNLTINGSPWGRVSMTVNREITMRAILFEDLEIAIRREGASIMTVVDYEVDNMMYNLDNVHLKQLTSSMVVIYRRGTYGPTDDDADDTPDYNALHDPDYDPPYHSDDPYPAGLPVGVGHTHNDIDMVHRYALRYVNMLPHDGEEGSPVLDPIRHWTSLDSDEQLPFGYPRML